MYHGNWSKMLIGRLFHASIRFEHPWFLVNSRLGVGSLIDGNQNVFCPLVLEDEILQNYERHSNSLKFEPKGQFKVVCVQLSNRFPISKFIRSSFAQ